MRWTLLGECWGNPIIEDLYNQNLSPDRYYKGFGELIKKIGKAKRRDVKPVELIQTLSILKTDCRRNVLENIAKYEVDLFRVIILDWKKIVIPWDKRMVIGLDDDWRGVHIRTNYIGATITYGIEDPKPHFGIHPYKAKDETEQQYKENLEADIQLIKSFLGKC